MARPSHLRVAFTGALWALGSRLPHWGRRFVCAVGPWPISVAPVAGVNQWAINVEDAIGRQPSAAEKRAVISSWLRNNLMSLSLDRWSDEEILRRVIVTHEDVEKLRRSLAGPGLVLALPHMGSWDFAGAWCARVGIDVLSVAERLPSGVYERFRDARAGMGMEILPVGHPNLMRCLADAVHKGSAVCLLSDRDMSGHGLEVAWGAGASTIHVPAGPALLSRMSGCDLRVVTTRFHGDRVEILVGDRISIGTPSAMMNDVAQQFLTAVREAPSDWLMMQPLHATP